MPNILPVIRIDGGWHGLWNNIHAKGHNAWDVYLNLFERYTEVHRYYHRFPHVMRMLKEFEQVKHLCVNPHAVEMSLWCGRAIYRLNENHNEEKSAVFIEEIMYYARVDEMLINEVTRLILLTKKNETSQKDHDGALRLDIELAVLGSSPEVFSQYERGIEKEYDYVRISRDTFISERKKMLIELIQRKSIYHTEHFRERYEEQAEKNLMRSLEQLASGV